MSIVCRHFCQYDIYSEQVFLGEIGLKMCYLLMHGWACTNTHIYVEYHFDCPSHFYVIIHQWKIWKYYLYLTLSLHQKLSPHHSFLSPHCNCLWLNHNYISSLRSADIIWLHMIYIISSYVMIIYLNTHSIKKNKHSSIK